MKKIQKMPKSLATLTIALAILTAIGVWLGQDVLKAHFPQYFVTRAAASTMSEIMPQTGDLGILAREILANSWRQDISLSLNDIYTRGFFAIDRETGEALSQFSLHNTTRRNMSQDAFISNFDLRFLGSPIFKFDAYLDRDILSFRVPQAYDAFVYGNLRSYLTEYHASVFGSPWRNVDESDDEEFYNQINAFTTFDWSADLFDNNFFPDIVPIFEELIASSDFRFLRRWPIYVQDNRVVADFFQVTIPGDALYTAIVSFAGQLIDSHAFYFLPWDMQRDLRGIYTEEAPEDFPDIVATVYVSGRNLVGIDLEVENLIGEIRITEDGIILFDLQYQGTRTKDIVTGEFAFDTTDRLYYSLTLNMDEYWDEELRDRTAIQFSLDWDIHSSTGDNFSIEMDTSNWSNRWGSGNRMLLSVIGAVRGFEDGIEANFGQILLTHYSTRAISEIIHDEQLEFELSLNLGYNLRVYDRPIFFDRDAAIHFSDFTDEMYREGTARMDAWADEMEEKFSELFGW